MKKSLVIATLAILLVVPLVSAGFLDVLSGKATSDLTNVTVTVQNTPPTFDIISLNASTLTLLEDTSKLFNFSVTVSDHDGATDIPDTSLYFNITRPGQPTLTDHCSLDSNLNFTTDNFTCTFTMWYFYEPGQWNMSFAVSDSQVTVSSLNQTYATVNQLQAITMSPNSLAFATLAPGDVDKIPTNDPTVLNNTGNANFASIQINATNLTGETTSTYAIQAVNFNADTSTGTVCTSGTTMAGQVFTTVTGAVLNRGNHTVNDGTTGQEQVYYCLTSVDSGLIKQTYSTGHTGGEGPWTIKVI